MVSNPDSCCTPSVWLLEEAISEYENNAKFRNSQKSTPHPRLFHQAQITSYCFAWTGEKTSQIPFWLPLGRDERATRHSKSNVSSNFLNGQMNDPGTHGEVEDDAIQQVPEKMRADRQRNAPVE